MKDFQSLYDIGDRVAIRFEGGENCGAEIIGYVRAVIFTSSKVRYSVMVLAGQPSGAMTPEQIKARLNGEDCDPEKECAFTVHNVDSALIHSVEGEPMEMPADNYS